MRQLKGLQTSQQVQSLSVGAKSWDVVVWDIQLTQYSRFDIGFEIEVRPLTERLGSTNNSQSSESAAASLNSSSGDLLTASSGPPGSGFDFLTP